ncbi:transglutaminase domain-containing protein [Leeuwenhoekiella sp. W20_SRS_FM14]|uniref:DUF3857 domain-containing protein n=1 Tax=Leeuwenhoekiella sp. W20_SRS_FM14 TaxID=3240270 RepID=UPI003F946DC1
MHKTTLFLFFLITTVNFGQDFRFGKVSVEELKEESHALDSDADAAILFREQYSHIDYSQNNGFTLTTEIYERIKIYNAEGFEWGTHVIPIYQGGGDNEEDINSLKAVTYTLENGKVVETKLQNDGIFKEVRNKFYNVEKFTMPNLQAGCIIEFKYKLVSPFLSNIDEIRLQEDIPLNKADIRFYSPEWLVYQMHRKGLQPFKVEESSKAAKLNYVVRVDRNAGFATLSGSQLQKRNTTQNQTIDYQANSYSINVENVPAMKDEVFSSNIDNYRSAITFELAYTKYPNEPFETITSTWEAVSKTIYDSENFGGQLKNDRFYADDVDAVISGSTTSEEKATRIYEFVKQKMNWNKYIGIYADEGVKDAYKTGVGNTADINLLLVSMLRYAGLDANPIILSTRDNGIPLFPTRNGFNDVIAGVKLDENVILMDATHKMGAANLLEEKLLNWNGRLIREDGTSEWVSLNPTKHALENTMLNLEITEDLAISCRARSQYTGNYGLSYRRNYSGKSDQESLETLEERYSGIEINELEIKNIEEVYEPVELNYSFEMLDGIEEIGGKLYISPFLHLATQENPFKSEERKHPVDFMYPWKDRFIINIKLPQGYVVESLPQNEIVNLAEDLGVFKYLISNTNGYVQVSCEMALNSSIITPQYYQDLKKFYELIVSKQNNKIVLSKV